MFYVCVFLMYFFLSNLYLYNTVLSVLFCVNKDIIIIWRVENWITGVCSPYVVSLCDFAYYVFG